MAPEGGLGEVVKLLLQQTHINPNTADTQSGLKALSWAEISGHKRAGKPPLGREDTTCSLADTKCCLTGRL